ncbi:MAG: pyrimidine 5'-nucleotidase [Anaerolineales bacterium]|jgi:pyrimidine 5'-nucleotidase
MSIETLFFDLDGTLYPNDNGLWEIIGSRMNQFMVERIGIPEDSVSNLRSEYFLKYGTTLRGLQIHHQVNADEYLKFVHDLPLEDYLQPQPALRELLQRLPPNRWIFTNADKDHAYRVISTLGLLDCFEGIIDIRTIDFICKPNPEAYQKAIAIAGSPNEKKCIMIDDSTRNLITAKEKGLTTVLVGESGELNSSIDYVISNLSALQQEIPELWEW